MISFFLPSLPIFAVIGVGWAAARTRLVAQGALDALNAFSFRFALPALLLRLIAGQPLRQSFNAAFYIGCLASGAIIVGTDRRTFAVISLWRKFGGLHARAATFVYVVPLPNIFLTRLFSKLRLKRKDFQEILRLPWEFSKTRRGRSAIQKLLNGRKLIGSDLASMGKIRGTLRISRMIWSSEMQISKSRARLSSRFAVPSQLLRHSLVEVGKCEILAAVC